MCFQGIVKIMISVILLSAMDNLAAWATLKSPRSAIYHHNNTTGGLQYSKLKNQDKKLCKISIANYAETLEARESIIESIESGVATIVIKLVKPGSIKQLFGDRELENRLLEWHVVSKKDTLMNHMPVDFDVVTFKMLSTRDEETVQLSFDSTPCLINETSVSEMRRIIWSSFLRNISGYYLCNRKYEYDMLKETLYYVTTLWIGHDLECSIDDMFYPLSKRDMHFLLGISSFVVSLQFVHIFRILKHTQKRTLHYLKDDRPYGIKRVLLQFLYYKTRGEPSEKNIKNHETSDNSPYLRLSFFIIWVIFFPVGLYRVVGRKNINDKMHDFNVLRYSEPFCDSSNSYTCDVLYMFTACCCGTLTMTYYLKYILPALGKKNETNEYSPMVQLLKYSSFTCILSKSWDSVRTYLKESPAVFCLTCILAPFIVFISVLFVLLLTLYEILSIIVCVLLFYICLAPLPRSCKCGTKFSLNAVYILSSPFVLRSLVSTSTFLVRSFTYFVMVALLRPSIAKNFIIFVFTIAYIIKYLIELVDLFQEMLNVVFEENRTTESENRESDTENLQQETEIELVKVELFSHVFDKVNFAKERKYTFVSKCVLIFFYLFIAINTLSYIELEAASDHFQSMIIYAVVTILPMLFSFNYNKKLSIYQQEQIRSAVRDFLTKTTENGNQQQQFSFRVMGNIPSSTENDNTQEKNLNGTGNNCTESST